MTDPLPGLWGVYVGAVFWIRCGRVHGWAWTGTRASPQAARACAWVHVGRGCRRPLGQIWPPPALAHRRRGDLASPQPWPVWREGLAEGGLGAKHGQLGIVCGADLSWENSQISQSDSHNQIG